jgi:hypothetical protein
MPYTEKQIITADSLNMIVTRFGLFDQDDDANGCDYRSESDNKNHAGKCCMECIFQRGSGCAIVSGTIEPMGVCRFWIISEDRLTESEYADGSEEEDGNGQSTDGQSTDGQVADGQSTNGVYETSKSIPYQEEIKSISDDGEVYRGLGVVWGGKDLVGDTFTKSTEVGSERPFKGMPLYFDHAQGEIKDAIGTVLDANSDDSGMWFDFQLNKRHKYASKIKELIKTGALGLSTGAISHLVTRDSGELKCWVIGELSLTPTPAEPRTLIHNTPKVNAEASDDAQLRRPTVIIYKR